MTKAILETQNSGDLENLTREDLLGDLFHAGLLGYYGQLTTLSYVAGLRQGGHHILAAGLGSYGYEPEVTHLFGIPRNIYGGGAAMNIPIVSVWGHDNDGSEEGKQSRLNYVLQVGTLSSALEHAVPEQMFVTEENPGEAISAVKALSKASAAGQRIYHITQANQASVLPNIHHNELVMNEIRNALNAGKEVITHTDAVSAPGWSGAGYIIYDPVTGDGAYKIGGGANGAFLFALILSIIGMVIAVNLVFFGVGWAILGGIALFLWEGFSFLSWINSIKSADTTEEFNQATMGHILTAALGLLPFSEAAAAAKWFGVIFSTMIALAFG